VSDSAVKDYAHVRDALRTGDASGGGTGRPAFDRLLQALDHQASYRPRTRLDLAVLIRHALRYESARRGEADIEPHFEIPNRDSLPSSDHWKTVGVQFRPSKRGVIVTALPWEPDWLLPNDEAADFRAARGALMRRTDVEKHSPDPFLKKLGKDFYRSPGQRVAVRAALTMPQGTTLLITLPTGEGKSLVFESLDHFEGGGSSGVTPVIVPTVALALDHEKSVQRRLKTDRPFAYVGGSPHRTSIVEAIKNGEQGLCFMAPESACGPLQAPLLEAVRNGSLGALIIDEAHLVEAWGVDFRTSFPMLSALRARMLEEAKPEEQLRTVLLSATLTQMAVDTLRSLFSDGDMGFVNGVRLRSELHFFTARDRTAEAVRVQRVVEAVSHLPRPLILYASTPKEVSYFYRLLRERGYGNIAEFHGGTSSVDRERILDAWRKGTLDMVVGNSAFGLGIDYPHVRAVVHACMPETLDRLYQEVGRCGRDGCASVSVLITAFGDQRIAENLNRQKVITLERGLQRWRSMFTHQDRKTLEGTDRYGIRLNVSPSSEEQDLDMVGLRSVDWNARILTVMARVGLLRILNRYEDPETGYPWADVEILRHDHETEDAWDEIVRLRIAIHDNNANNLRRMEQYIGGKACLAPLLTGIYTTNAFTEYEAIVPVCSGCPACGAKGNGLSSDAPVPAIPWGVPCAVNPRLAARFDHNGMLVVVYPVHDLPTGKFQRELKETLQSLHAQGFVNLFVLGAGNVKLWDKALAFDTRKPFFVSYGKNWLDRSLLPPGPEIVFMLPGFMQTTPLSAGRKHGERLVFIPDNLRDPSRPDGVFTDTHSGNSIRFEAFRIQVRR